MKNKRILSFLLIFTLLSMSVPAFAEETEYTAGDYTYIILKDGTAEITRFTGIGKNLSLQIPSELNGRAVTSIGYEWSTPYDFFVFNSNEVYFEAMITVKNGLITEITIPRDY